MSKSGFMEACLQLFAEGVGDYAASVSSSDLSYLLDCSHLFFRASPLPVFWIAAGGVGEAEVDGILAIRCLFFGIWSAVFIKNGTYINTQDVFASYKAENSCCGIYFVCFWREEGLGFCFFLIPREEARASPNLVVLPGSEWIQFVSYLKM